ncbi:nucleotide exchange factor GrpE [Mycobacteroides immunogenum]|uniref:Protein GrpE n=1 Tax=Mycobacteroides immunogenum TaxID=83262 RepID=A0A7V8LNV9_9MYCO|nr:nucleotide exchange factor GrpE [Mycobacteroides immunogenum]AMT72902.1 molecular chaperone GrpE [Mycobacteroides immunogenum]ANO06064.1 nucleotide exchange factor GrpE [Mycobacteroides immunogenum]KIU41380.1 molecular chaperone GrpE [Mycobacteroides immunogenum]KPG07933.1 molecular chaperone GrpE [Mycobacteroides immunogenum]KPG09428.1 molecular chaperone GrpE [Mycobacteroides immunogenum]
MTSSGGQDREEEREPVTVTDKRRIDPNTGAVREEAKAADTKAAAAEPGASAPGAAASEGGSDADAKVAELTADLQRAHADFANYRKRVERDRQAVIDSAKASVVTQLLGVLDDLDRAREHGDLESGPLRSVSDKLTAALEGLGLATFGAEGDDFDPSLHEAVQHDGQDGHPVLAAVLRKGYKLGDRVLRPAMVVVTDGDTVQQEPGTADAETKSETESE